MGFFLSTAMARIGEPQDALRPPGIDAGWSLGMPVTILHCPQDILADVWSIQHLLRDNLSAEHPRKGKNQTIEPIISRFGIRQFPGSCVTQFTYMLPDRSQIGWSTGPRSVVQPRGTSVIVSGVPWDYPTSIPGPGACAGAPQCSPGP